MPSVAVNWRLLERGQQRMAGVGESKHLLYALFLRFGICRSAQFTIDPQ